ncbi:MAG: HD domain-containing protein [Lachnospiraceae bacterium]|nr:HD domain-containing protein [Lachnospiraceae bacterium]
MKELFRRKTNLSAVLFCVAGIAVNLILDAIVGWLKLPLYLDTVGTVVVASIGGYLPGVIVGFTTSALQALSDPSSLTYVAVNCLIALCAAFFSSRGGVKRIRGVLIETLVFTLIGAGLGSMLQWFVNGFSSDPGSLSGILYETGYFGPAAAHALSGLLSNLLDKGITAFAAFAIVHFIPEKFYSFFGLRLHLQNEIPSTDLKKEKSRVRRLSLRMKVFLALFCSLTAVALISTALSAKLFKKMLINDQTHFALAAATLAAGAVEGDYVDSYLHTQDNAWRYLETKNQLKKIWASNPEVSFLYVYRPEPEGFRVVFDIDTEAVAGDRAGTLIPYDEGSVPYITSFLSGNKIEAMITRDEYGYLLTVAVPVYDSEGSCVCYAFADVDMTGAELNGRSFLMEMIAVFLGFFILVCTFFVWLVDYHLVIPINSVARGLDRLAHTPDDQRSMDEDVKMFRRLGIHTGDELEALYRSASSMTKNQAEQMRSIRRLSDSTSHMQDGLIITMADLVESRDSDTGAHVQKTAAYVRIIVEGLKKKGYYPQKLTPKFMSDVVRSAPLHDVGKINIPDQILNKPGKLTDEEYEIMKTHTQAGKRIMERAISSVEGDSYLKEARNMAAYHHERWDGKGYPEGIHGEVIPLAARIMAVADVFDALSSPRVYKQAFPLEKCLAILEEGKGTQFDPKCVEVFMEALPEVKVVLRKFNKDV